MQYTKKTYLISGKRLDEMIDNGWTLKLMEWVLEEGSEYKSLEGKDAFYTRLINEGYTRVKLYEVSTRIRGYHKVIAMVKR